MVRIFTVFLAAIFVTLVCAEAKEGDRSSKADGSSSKATSAKGKAPRTLEGAWKGTFTRNNPDGSSEANEYLVRVSPDFQIEVSRVNEAKSNPDLQPITAAGPVAGTRDANGVTWQVLESRDSGEEKTEVVKNGSLRLEEDGRHALFTYDIKVVVTSATGTENHSLQGSGRLSRAR